MEALQFKAMTRVLAGVQRWARDELPALAEEHFHAHLPRNTRAFDTSVAKARSPLSSASRCLPHRKGNERHLNA